MLYFLSGTQIYPVYFIDTITLNFPFKYMHSTFLKPTSFSIWISLPIEISRSNFFPTIAHILFPIFLIF